MEHIIENGTAAISKDAGPENGCFLINNRGEHFQDPSVIHFENPEQVDEAIESLEEWRQLIQTESSNE